MAQQHNINSVAQQHGTVTLQNILLEAKGPL